MKTSTLVLLSAIGWSAIPFWAGDFAAGTVFLFCHALYWRTHILEVKLNRLLDERGIFVADYELNE